MPGLIDPHCHLGVKYPYNEDMRTETAAAAVGRSHDRILYIRNKSGPILPFYKERRAIGEQNSMIDFGFHFGIQREEHIHEIPQIVDQNRGPFVQMLFRLRAGQPDRHRSGDRWLGLCGDAYLVKVPSGVISVHCENTGSQHG